MTKISGILTDGAGQIINDCTIELYAKKTTSKVLTQTQAFKVANNGSYTMDVLPCEYDVSLIINGFPKKRLGTIQVFSDSLDGTLNDFLLNPSESEITPLILQQVVDARNEAKQAATKAETSEKNSKTSETNAAQSAKNAKTSETNSANSASSASQSATNADSSARSALSSATSAQDSADNANNSATSASQSETNASNSAESAKKSENSSKTSETNAAQSAKDAQKWASTVDNSNFIKKSGESNQSIDGSLDVKKLTENGVRVYSPDNKPTADDIGALTATKTVVDGVPIYKIGGHLVCSDWIGKWDLMPFRRNELPFGWYFRNGDNYLLSSPQGQALNSLSANYKNDHRITIKTINGLQYINVPTAFAPDGRGFFIRAVNGTTRQVGSIEDDAIREIWGHFDTGVVAEHSRYSTGAFAGVDARNPDNAAFQVTKEWKTYGYDFNASRIVPTANENRVINIGGTPAIYLGV